LNLRRLLTRRVRIQDARGKKTREVVLEPDEKLVYGVRFAIAAIACLSAMEVASMAFMHTWNSEVFASVTGLVGLVTGILVGSKS
jgi:hypothetical protein